MCRALLLVVLVVVLRSRCYHDHGAGRRPGPEQPGASRARGGDFGVQGCGV